MPDLTPNLNLKKPNWDTEAADIRVFNDNMDIIDEKITDGNKTIQNLEEKKQNKEDSTLKTIAKKIVEAINELFDSKLEKGGYTGNAKNLNDEISKKASKTVLGRMIVGDNLTVDDNGRVSATKTEIVNDLTTGGADKAGSADMVKKLGEDKQNKTDNELETNSKKIVGAINEINAYGYTGQGRGTFRKDSLNIDQIKKSGAWYIYDKGLIPFIGTDYAYLQHIQYNGADVGAWQLMCPDNKLELYTRVCAGISGKYTDWEQILTSNNKLFLGNAGINKVTYIQDAGQKVKGFGYIDKATGKLYKAKETNNDVTVTSNFEPADNINNSNKNTYDIVFEGEMTTGKTITLDINKYRYFLARGRWPSVTTFIPKEYDGELQVVDIPVDGRAGSNGGVPKVFNLTKNGNVISFRDLQGNSAINNNRITIYGVI